MPKMPPIHHGTEAAQTNLEGPQKKYLKKIKGSNLSGADHGVLSADNLMAASQTQHRYQSYNNQKEKPSTTDSAQIYKNSLPGSPLKNLYSRVD